MKVNEYQVMQDCVAEGILHGWTQAHKHTDKPDQEQIHLAIERAVMLHIGEYFSFEGHE